MPTRLRLYDCRLSRLPELVGKCVGDTVSIANFVNSAQRRLLMCKEAGDEGWYGTFAEVQFNGISRTTPYITLPREIARLEALNICKQPVAVSNQFTEYLQFGNGRLPKTCPRDVGCDVGVYSRNNAVTFVNVPAGSILRVYTTNAADYTSSLRILLQGTDTSDSVIYSQDGANQVQGIFLNFNAPF